MEKQKGFGVIQEINRKMYYATSYGYLEMEYHKYKNFSIPLDTSYPVVDDKKGMHILNYNDTSNSCGSICLNEKIINRLLKNKRVNTGKVSLTKYGMLFF